MVSIIDVFVDCSVVVGGVSVLGDVANVAVFLTMFFDFFDTVCVDADDRFRFMQLILLECKEDG